MPTIQQLIRKPRQPKKRGAKNPALKANPQKRGVASRTATQWPVIFQVKAITYKSIVLFSCAAAALVTSQVSVTQLSVVALTRSRLKIVRRSAPNMVLSVRSKPSLHINNKEPSQRCGGFFLLTLKQTRLHSIESIDGILVEHFSIHNDGGFYAEHADEEHINRV